jgi:ankyrin repeat protein
MLAAMAGYSSTVSFLLSAGANMVAVDKHGCTALEFAAINGHESTVLVLLARGAAHYLA